MSLKRGNFVTLQESVKVPDCGTIKKRGKKTYFTFEVTAPMEEFESMDDAKEAFKRHHHRLQKIMERYFYMSIRANIRKRAGFADQKHDLVGRILAKLGFIDED